MENQTVKENKVIWARDFHGFCNEIEKVFSDGWTIIPSTLHIQILPNVSMNTLHERYFAVVEK